MMGRLGVDLLGSQAGMRPVKPAKLKLWAGSVALMGACLSGSLAFAHGANPAVAWLDNPVGVGTVVDTELAFTWVDFDMSIPTGTATIDFYYSARRPPAYQIGEIHPLLEGTPIVQGILEKAPENRHVWDTSAVPPGAYFIWSQVIEPPEEFMAPQIISFSPGVVSIAHPGDPVHPAILMTTPDTPFRFADDSYTLSWLAFDPDGSARVKLEAGTSSMGVDFQLLAENLDPLGPSFEWDTSELEDKDWFIRATITDGRGLSFTTYSEYVLAISHPPERPDAGVADAGASDAGAFDDASTAEDAGFTKGPATGKCTCTQASGSGWAWSLWLGLFGALGLRARGSRRAGHKRRPH